MKKQLNKDYRVLNVAEIGGQQYAIVDAGSGYMNGMFAKYLMVPLSSIDRPMENDVRIYDENIKV
jgi:hypothetical protein